MREPEIRPHCDDNYICEKYGINRISLSCQIKIKMHLCPRYHYVNGEIKKKDE